jgi:hypothetical protein
MSYGFIRANLTASVPPFMDGGGLNPRSAFLFNNSDYGVKPDPISFLRLDLFQKTVVWGFDLDIYFIGLHLHQAVAFFSLCPWLLQPTKYRYLVAFIARSQTG